MFNRFVLTTTLILAGKLSINYTGSSVRIYTGSIVLKKTSPAYFISAMFPERTLLHYNKFIVSVPFYI